MDFTPVNVLIAQCASPQDLSIYGPVTPAGESIAQLSFLVYAITGGIFAVVSSILAYCVIRFRNRGESLNEPPQVYGSIPIELAWTAAPLLIVFFLTLVTTRTLWEVEIDPPQPAIGDKTLFVTVVGRQWWWEYRYDFYDGKPLGFATANELNIPAGDDEAPRRTYLRLASADVCHSFWVPRLGGKTDLIPGRINSTWIETKTPGLYLGQCAEFCGTQHAGMLLRVEVEKPAEFAAWLDRERAGAGEGATAESVAAVPTADARAAIERGRATFQALSCVNCHAVRGTPAVGTFGPDLTHLKSRQTLASGLIPNDREHLRAWLVDPQVIKPGCLMPSFRLNDAQLDDVVVYLETLR